MNWSDVKLGRAVVEKRTKKIYTIIAIREDITFDLGSEYINGCPGGFKSVKKKCNPKDFDVKGA